MIVWSAVKNPEANEPTDKNVDKVVEFIKKQIDEQVIKVPSGSVMTEFINRRLRTWVRNAYTARDMQEGDQYVIASMGDKKGQTMVMDLATGTEQPNTHWSNGLQQFVQIKQFNKLSDESLKAIFMSNMTFFKSYYSNINGMTGTLGGDSERQFLVDTYGLDCFKLPRFREERYVEELGVVEPSIDKWKQAIVQDVAEKMESHRNIDREEIAAAEKDIKEILPSHLKTLKDRVNSLFASNLDKPAEIELSLEQEIEQFKKQIEKLEKSEHEKEQKGQTTIKSIEIDLQELESKLAQHQIKKVMLQEEHDDYAKKLQASLKQLESLGFDEQPSVILEEKFEKRKFNTLRGKYEEYEKEQVRIDHKKHELERELEIHNQILTPEKALKIRIQLLDQQKEKLQALEAARTDAISKVQAIEKIKKELAELIINLHGNEAIKTEKTPRAVLIICENQLAARALYDALAIQYPNKVYKYDSAFGKLPLEKVGPGDIIVATNLAGRGTDLETTELLEKNGGLHVILSYMPGNVRIEAQAFGRTARKGHEGTGKYIVCDHRAASLPLSVEFLRDERDQNEAERLDTIIRTKLPRINLEEKLFGKFASLQDLLRKQLRENGSEEDFIQLQIKSLQDRWAFWLDKNSKAIDDVYKDGETNVLWLYDDFEQSIKHDLTHDEYGLIDSPGELFKLAKYYIAKEDKKENYAAAERCYDKIISKTPNFSAFAHYYKVMCIFWQGSTFEDKQLARKSLKEAVRLFEEDLARSMQYLQIVKTIGDEKQKSGQGQEVDFFSQNITNQMCFINVHLEAAKEALGQELSIKTFTNGTIAGEDSEKVFANIRQHLDIIKDKRVSKKIEFKWEINIPGEINWAEIPISSALKNGLLTCKDKSFLCDSVSNEDAKTLKQHGVEVYRTIVRGQNKLHIISQFATHRDSIVALLEEKVKIRKADDKTVIDFDEFSKFSLTKQKFKEYIDSIIDKSVVYRLHKEVQKHSKGEQFWQDAVFKKYGLAIKSKILTIVNSIAEAELNELISSVLKEELSSPDNIKEICIKLKDTIISEEKSYRFNADAKKQLATLCQSMKLNLDIPVKTIEKLEFDNYCGLREKASNIKSLLLQAIKDKNTKTLSKKELGLDEQEFKMLWKILNQQELLDFDLLDVLGIKNKVNSLYCKNTVQAILFLSEKEKFDDTDIPFSDDVKKQIEGLWSQLKDQKIVKDPAVLFSLNRDPEKAFDRIKDYVEEHLEKLIAGTTFLKESTSITGQKIKTIQDRDKLIDSISKSLELAIGKIKFLPKLKLSEKTIQDYYKEGEIPPEIVEYTRRCCDGVLNLVKDASWFSWDAFACAMIGIAQIVAGAVLIYVGMGFIGQILIREGIGDIVFAVQSSLAGNFNWKSYGEHKLVSLAISTATAGFGALVSGAELGGKAISEASNAVGYVLAKVGESAFDAAIAVGVNLLSSQIVDLASKSIFENLLNSYSQSIDKSQEIIDKKQAIQNKFEELCKKFGIDDANAIIGTCLSELNLKQKIEGMFATQVMKYTQMAAQELSKRTDTVGTIAKIGDAVLKCGGAVKVVAEMTANTKAILEELENSLQKYDSVKPKQDIGTVDNKKAKEFAKAKKEETSKVIISQIQASIQSMVLQPAAQLGVRFAVNAATEGLRNELFKEIHGLEEWARREHSMEKAGRGELVLSEEERAENLAALKKLPGGELLSADQVKDMAGQVILDGNPISLEEAAKLYGRHAYFIKQENTYYIIKPDYRQILANIKEGMPAGVFELRVLATATHCKIIVLDGSTMKPHELAPKGISPFEDGVKEELTIALENGHYIPCEKDAYGNWKKVENLNSNGVKLNECAAQAVAYAAHYAKTLNSAHARSVAENGSVIDQLVENGIFFVEQSEEAKKFYYSGEQDKTPGLLGGYIDNKPFFDKQEKQVYDFLEQHPEIVNQIRNGAEASKAILEIGAQSTVFYIGCETGVSIAAPIIAASGQFAPIVAGAVCVASGAGGIGLLQTKDKVIGKLGEYTQLFTGGITDAATNACNYSYLVSQETCEKFGKQVGIFFQKGVESVLSSHIKTPIYMAATDRRKKELNSKGYQEHHIVSDKNKSTKDMATEAFNRAGLSTDSRINKIFLPNKEGIHPTRSIHDGRHFQVVNDTLASKLDSAMRRGEQHSWNKTQHRDALVDILSNERKLLRTGERALNKNKTPNARPQSPAKCIP